jgi:hypothetical protein
MTLRLTGDYSTELEKKINYVTQYNSKAYYRTALKKVSKVHPENAGIICDYIMAEQTQMNIKESTKEGKMKVLTWLSNYFENKKSFRQMTKQDILDYLNSSRKPVSEDPTHRWIGSYNGRQMIFNKFFRWLYNPDEPTPAKRTTPPCMIGVRRLSRQEKSPYKPSSLWGSREHAIFLKYCPSIRDRCYHAMANDMSGSFKVVGSDPHHFDGDSDGIGCEGNGNGSGGGGGNGKGNGGNDGGKCDPAYPDDCIPSPPPDLDL